MSQKLDFIQSVSQEVVTRAVKGDRSAFKEIYNAYCDMGYTIALRIVGEPMMAQDVTQEAFIQVFKHIGGFRGENTLVAWIKRIVVNQAINRLKANNKFAADEMLDDVLESGLFGVDWLQASIDLESLVQKLSTEQRSVFVLHEVEGFNHSEIAGMFGKSVSFSKVTLMRAYASLKSMVTEARG